MKTLLLTLFITFLFGGSDLAQAKGVKEVKVQINKQARVSGTKFTVKFLELVEDSRCPTGTNCIWAGNAKIKIQITKNGKAAKILELNTNGPETAALDGYIFKLIALTPHPAINIRINRNGYIATISVNQVQKTQR
ncbi:MAG: hypothetical protein WKF92_11350 [Pyrinomonadaceae bacterium]